MEEWFYTDASRTQQGPVGGDTLLGLNRSGEINAESLVWKEGMLEWLKFSQIAAPLFGEYEEGFPVEIGVCAHSRGIYLRSEMMPYGEALIGVEQKDSFVQHLMESGNTGIADATEPFRVYVGFWWRVLGACIDYMVKIIPSYLCMIPYYIVIFTSDFKQSAGSDPEKLEEPLIAMAIAMGVATLGMLAISIFYDTWMVGKYGGTLGKLAIGAKVVNPDGSRLTYGRAFLRWFAKKPINMFIVYVPATIALSLFMVMGSSAFNADDDTVLGITAMLAGMVAYVLVGVLFSGIYWMCAFDEEKRTLHDRICATRVVKK